MSQKDQSSTSQRDLESKQEQKVSLKETTIDIPSASGLVQPNSTDPASSLLGNAASRAYKKDSSEKAFFLRPEESTVQAQQKQSSVALETKVSGEIDEPESFDQGETTTGWKAFTFLRIIKLMLRHKGVFFQGFVMIILGTLSALFEPRLFGFAIDEAILPQDWNYLKAIAMVYFAVTCIKAFSVARQGYLFEALGQEVTHALRTRLFSHITRLPVEVFDKTPAGKLMTRATNDIGALNEMFSAGFLTMVCNFFLIIGIVTWLFILDFRLAVIALSVFPVLIVASVYFSKRLKKAYHQVRNQLSLVNGFLAENFSGIRIVQIFNRQKEHLARFEKINQRYADAQTGSIRVFALFQPLITLASGISVALVIGVGGEAAWSNTLSVGVLVAFFTYVLSLFQPLREIADKWNVFLSGMASAERIFAILDWETEMPESASFGVVKPLSGIQGHIVFENVWFAYKDENWVIQDFNLEILPGEKVGIVGHTGAGKSSLIGLLLRFYEPQKGRILLDGKDIRTFDKRALRASLGVIQQDPFLFRGTYEENATFWNSHRQPENTDAAQVPPPVQALLDRVSMKSSAEGAEALLGERGVSLSMGERQILAFVRAAIMNPPIWILDEATAHLDSHQEQQLEDLLDSLAGERTQLIIAHRLATVRNLDRIIVLSAGKLCESGEHQELMSQEGLYARLYRYQLSQADLQIQNV